MLYDFTAANGCYCCASEVCDFEMPFRKKKKKEKGEKQWEKTAPSVLASEHLSSCLELKAGPGSSVHCLTS